MDSTGHTVLLGYSCLHIFPSLYMPTNRGVSPPARKFFRRQPLPSRKAFPKRGGFVSAEGSFSAKGIDCAAAQLEHALGALTYVTNECSADLEKYCSAIKPGEGRLAACLKKNENTLSERCQQAIKDIKLDSK